MSHKWADHILVLLVLLCSPVTTFSAGPGCPELLKQKNAQSVSHSASLSEIFQAPEVREIVRDGESMQVLADLLLERGHSYGEFLSLWAEWHQELKSVGSASVSSRASNLAKKISFLLDQEIRSWIPEGIGHSIRTVIFREDGQIRGLVLDRRLQEFVSHGGIEFMQALKMDTLEIVDPGRLLAPDVPELSVLAGFSKVNTLRTLLLVSRNLVGMAGLPELAAFTGLEAFGLRTVLPIFASDHAVLISSIAKMTRLKTVLLEGLDHMGALGRLSTLRELTELGIGFTHVSQDDLSALGQFTRLQKVVLNRVNYVSELERYARETITILPPEWAQQEMRAVLERLPLLAEFQVSEGTFPSRFHFSRKGMAFSETLDWNIGSFPNRSEQWKYGFDVSRMRERQVYGLTHSGVLGRY